MTTDRTQKFIKYFAPLITIDKEAYTLWHDLNRTAAGAALANGLRSLPGYEDLAKPHAVNKAAKWLKGQEAIGEKGLFRRELVKLNGPLMTGNKGVKIATEKEAQLMAGKKVHEAEGKVESTEIYVKDAVAKGFVIEAPVELNSLNGDLRSLRKLLNAKPVSYYP